MTAPTSSSAASVSAEPAPGTSLPTRVVETHTGTGSAPAGPVSTPSDGKSASDLLLGLLVSGALVTALVTVILNRRKSLEDERARIRATCADAVEVVAAYKEFPYAIRRRQKDRAAEERIRLADDMRRVQARLSYFTTWMGGEDPLLAAAFDDLVKNLRRVAGKACHDAWLAPPNDSDADMNFAPGVVDLAELAPYEDAYMAAVKIHLDGLLKTRRILSISSLLKR